MFFLGTTFVAWSEQRRTRNFKIEVLSSVKNTLSEVEKNISSEPNLLEWNVLRWLDDKVIPEIAKQVGGWSLVEADVTEESTEGFSINQWLIELIYLPALSTTYQRNKKLLIEKNLKIREVDYIFHVGRVSRYYWIFSLETYRPGVTIPTDFKLILVNMNGKKWVRKVSRASKIQERLSIKVFVAQGDRIIWDIEPKPDNYSNEILRF